jgi:hypothetical protein
MLLASQNLDFREGRCTVLSLLFTLLLSAHFASCGFVFEFLVEIAVVSISKEDRRTYGVKYNTAEMRLSAQV